MIAHPCTAFDTATRLLTPEGTPVPGSADVRSDGDLIELLQLYLETELGDDTFAQAYQFLKVHRLLMHDTRIRQLTVVLTSAISVTSSASAASNTCHCSTNYCGTKTRSMQLKER